LNPNFTRRGLIQSLASCAAFGALGSMGAISQNAMAAAADRKFLFFFAPGGWDATPLDPKYGVGGTDMDPNTILGTAGNLTYSSGDDRLAMDLFFQNWFDRTAILRGINGHSVAHDTAELWMLTGQGMPGAPDWPTILGTSGAIDYPMPHLVFSGPSFPGRLGAAVVRGGGGSLLDLIDGSMLGYADQNAPVHVSAVDTMIDAHVWREGKRFADQYTGLGRVRADAFLSSLEKTTELEGRQFEAGLRGRTQSTTLDQALMALEVMRLGLTRCAMIRIPGSWDTHDGNQGVGPQLDEFFGTLDAVMAHMSRTPGSTTGYLADEVTVICLSEFGRTPRFNGGQGRDHWAYASGLAFGAGVNGNRAIGETDDSLFSMPVDFATGRPSMSGDIVGSENLGAAILEMGGVDLNQYMPGVQPLSALHGGNV